MAVSLKQEKGKVIFKLSQIDLDSINSKLLELFNKGLKEILRDNNVVLDFGDLGVNETEFKNIILSFDKFGINIDIIRSTNPITKMISVNYGINIDAPSVINTNNKLTPKTKLNYDSDKNESIKENLDNKLKINFNNFETKNNNFYTERNLKSNINEDGKNDLLIISRNLRSGNYVEDNRSILVIGNVNPGAEIRSASNIIVLGKLMGVAHAGYPNNYDAIVFTLSFNSSTIRIADLVGEYNEDLIKTKKKDFKNVLFKVSNSSIIMEIIKD